MKKIIFLMFIFTAQIGISQTNVKTKDTLIVKADNANIKALMKENIELRENILGLNEKLVAISYFKNNVQVGFWVAFVLTLVASFFSIFWATREVVYKQLSKFTGIEKSIIKRNLKQFDKHNNLKKFTKILVISKDGDFPLNFKKIMLLFNVDLNYSDTFKIIKKSDLLKDNYDFFRKYDIIVIENMYKETWDLKREPQNPSEKKDVNNFIALNDAICDKVSILYFGTYYPTKEKQDLISFSNASSQFYGNLLNMMKYRDEMGLNKICK